MHSTTEFLIQHGYLLLFGAIFLEQLGLPVPSFPFLLAAGALAGSGQMTLPPAVGVAAVAALLSDSVWFALGRARGATVLRWVCKISIEPDSCVRQTENIYARHGAKSLLVAKFIPGLNAVAAPLAGSFGMRLSHFLLLDTGGVLLWISCYLGLGYIFTDQLEDIAEYALRLGQFLVVLLAAALAASIARKYSQRQKFLRDLKIARITPLELKRMLDSGEPVQIVDMRHRLDFAADPLMLPGAVHFDPESADFATKIAPEIAPDREVVLYCT